MNIGRLAGGGSMRGIWMPAIALVSLVGFTGCGPTQVYVGSNPPPERVVYPAGQAPVAAAPAADPQLDQLVAPIALYPDPLIAELLPATTYPDQVAAAGQFLANNQSPTEADIDAQQWDPSVKAMCHYPAALKVLTDDPQWTASLGSAYSSDPKSVMEAIQDMRAQAQSSGSLVTTAQAAVVVNAGVIAIQPASVDLICVPTYDPVVVYTSSVPIVWGVGIGVGPWLGFGCDWGGGAVFVGDWHGPWAYDHGHWGYNSSWRADVNVHVWVHDSRFGPAPHIDRAHFAVARGVRGRKTELHATIDRHHTERATAARNAHNNTARPSDRHGETGRPADRTPRPGEKPAARPGEKPETARPGERTPRPGEKPETARPGDRTPRPGEKPETAKPGERERTPAKPAEKPETARPTDRDRTPAKPAEKPETARPTDRDRTPAKPAEKPETARPTDRERTPAKPAEKPAEKPETARPSGERGEPAKPEEKKDERKDEQH